MKFCMAFAALLLSSTSAFAADLAPTPVEPIAPVALPVTWTGFYIGAGLGARVANTDWETTTAFAPSGAPIPFLSSPNASSDSTSLRGSIYGGYNWQFSSAWVAGLEADIGYANNETTNNRIPGLFDVGASSSKSELGFDGSIRARLGYLITPSVLLYGTGGVAFQEIKNSTLCPADTNVCDPGAGTQRFSHDDTLVGWTIGAGAEALVYGNWLVRAEYRYSAFDGDNFTAIPPTSTTFGADAKTEVKTHTFGVGVAYKF
jgi:outer membrane immunogenic protein